MENQHPHILLVEDDRNLGFVIQDTLKQEGFVVHLATDGKEGLVQFNKQTYDLCLLDVMMPKKDGFTLAKDIRASHLDLPIIFLTAKSMEEDTLQGFKLGADDYLTKPFSMEVLLARMEAVLRRSKGQRQQSPLPEQLNLGAFTYFPLKHSLEGFGQSHKLTPKENELLKLLCENLGRPMSRSFALKLIWGDDTYFNARSMDVYMTKLRKLFKEDPSVQIQNLHGEGFRLSVSEA